MITVTISTTFYIIAHRQAFHKKNLRRPRIFRGKGNTSPPVRETEKRNTTALVDDFAFEIVHKSRWHINTILTFTKENKQNHTDEIVFKQSLFAILEKCSDEQNTLLKGRILFVSLCSIINIKIAFKIFSGATLGKILCWTAVLLYAVYISYKIFDLLWTRLFPDIVFALGEEIQKEDQRNHLKTNVIWGILVASIVSILLACII